MTIVLLQSSVVLLFVGYVFFDLVSINARAAGAVFNRNALGYSLAVMVNTVKRIFLVLYPPVLGVIALLGGVDDVVASVFACYLFSALPLFLMVKWRRNVMTRCSIFLLYYSRTGHLAYSAFRAMRMKSGLRQYVDVRIGQTYFRAPRVRKFSYSIVFTATWVYVFYSSSLFIVNLVGVIHAEYGPIVYQLVGLVNALGTIVFAFVLDPKISRMLEGREMLDLALNSQILGNGVSLAMGPVLMLVVLSILGYRDFFWL